ncbi:MAG TPA: metallophosphoesterase [Treponemataceae bacterium]|nr:metallophosphoesterase [Treponemataceae bacterium]
MKILCVSDQIDPLVYSSNVKERYKDVDLVISAGDLPMEYLEFIVSSLNKPVLFVFGNHNLSEFGQYHSVSPENAPNPRQMNPLARSMTGHGTTYIGFKTIKESGLLIAGVSGSLNYNNGLNQYSDAQMKRKLLKLFPALLYNRIKYGRWLDILVTHASPAGIHDKPDPCHQGFSSFLWFMKKFRPRWLIHGHIHLYDLQDIRVSSFEQTTVINAYSHFILDTGAPSK